MDKINNRKRKFFSVKWSFFIYLPICIVIALAGSLGIGVATNYLQYKYAATYSIDFAEGRAEIYTDENGDTFISMPAHRDDDGNIYVSTGGNTVFPNENFQKIYGFIGNSQVIVNMLWIMLCIGLMGTIFFRFELKKPIDTLMKSAEEISKGNLDFEISYPKENEMGLLCKTFDDMRKSVLESNSRLWRNLEERKRINTAFSHDLRTPLTVLKGYTEFLQNYSADKISEEKYKSVLEMMSGQIDRLENYTVKMNSLQKLEDIVPSPKDVHAGEIKKFLSETGSLVCKNYGRNFTLKMNVTDNEILFLDSEIIMQVYENILSNSARYASENVTAEIFLTDNSHLQINVYDDGAGFSENILKHGTEPFFRGEKSEANSKTHFGLGLYICKILCEKCGGTLTLSNTEKGGKVTAEFSQSR